VVAGFKIPVTFVGMLFFLLSLALMLFYAGYLVRMAWHFARLPVHAHRPGPLPRVSVIVPARNEATNVAACIQGLRAQAYPAHLLELILVDDHSEDATLAIAQAEAAQDSRLHILSLASQAGWAYKKAAVAAGIAQAQGDILLTTDADCVAGPDWVASMVACFESEVSMVAGPVLLTGSSVFAQFQALEFMGLIAVGAGAIGAGSPTMCNGANLAYRKAAFQSVGGFQGIDHIASGDDELLMHKLVAAGHQVRFAKSKAAIVRTPAQADWAGFKAQRIRWVSKSRHYDRKSITTTLVLSYLAMAGLPLMAVAALWWPMGWAFLGAAFALKMLAELAVLAQAASFFDNLRLLCWLPVEQAAHVAYVLWVGIAGNRKGYQWKGRAVQ
jgi:cellulose synthase/poly-beta-1,6-N-acetylglucosamine synthase-like glycosyltransferase